MVELKQTPLSTLIQRAVLLYVVFVGIILGALYFIAGIDLFSDPWDIVFPLMIFFFFFVSFIFVLIYFRERNVKFNAIFRNVYYYRRVGFINTTQKARYVIIFGVIILIKSLIDYLTSNMPSYFIKQLAMGLAIFFGGLRSYAIVVEIKKDKKNIDPLKNPYEEQINK